MGGTSVAGHVNCYVGNLGLYANIMDVPDGSKVLEFTQPDFVESMLSKFGKYIPDKSVSTPFKPS